MHLLKFEIYVLQLVNGQIVENQFSEKLKPKLEILFFSLSDNAKKKDVERDLRWQPSKINLASRAVFYSHSQRASDDGDSKCHGLI